MLPEHDPGKRRERSATSRPRENSEFFRDERLKLTLRTIELRAIEEADRAAEAAAHRR